MAQEVLGLRNITKVYPNGIVANKEVEFSVAPGEIHALMGENGAGKSTLMKIAFGMEQPDGGEIWLNGEKVCLRSSDDAIQKGIGMVHQHFMLVPSLTVAENMVLGIEPTRGKTLLDHKKTVQMVEEIGRQYHLEVDPHARVEDLAVCLMQRVEILKALIRGAKVLILDEPTAVLTPQETEELFRQLEILREEGHTIIFISHKLKEIKAICNRITIMRAGRTVGTYQVGDLSEADISRLMVGRDVVTRIEKSPMKPGAEVLKAERLVYVNRFGKQAVKELDFRVREGQILGVAGVEGNGQRELIDMVVGLAKPAAGSIQILGQDTGPLSIRQIRELGVAHIPEDRMKYGVALEGTIEENVMALKADSPELNRGPLFRMPAIHRYAQQLVEGYNVLCDSPQQPVGMLSGGNIQKVVVAREMESKPKLVVADQPTRGIDVGAAAFIHQKLVELRDAGCAILLSSADLNEVLELSDSLLILYGGQVVAWFEDSACVTEEELGMYMLGLKTNLEGGEPHGQEPG